jgi:hypothetical protein
LESRRFPFCYNVPRTLYLLSFNTLTQKSERSRREESCYS